MAKKKSLIDKVRDSFNYHNILVDLKRREIQCHWNRNPQGRIWVPYSGGPLYDEQAKDHARWLAGHITEFRSLLPKDVRDFTIVFGELDCRTFPGDFVRSLI